MASKRPARMMSSTSASSSTKMKVTDEVFFKAHGKGFVVHEEYSAKLSFSDVGGNNNKFYVIQLLTSGPSKYVAWNRWGRVGDEGQSKREDFSDPNKAIKAFEKKFQDKTGNAWINRNNFVKKSGKYELLDIDESAEVEPVGKKGRSGSGASGKLSPSPKLPKELNEVLMNVLEDDMFKEEMKYMGVDVAKMPLGALTSAQISKGNAILQKISNEIAKPKLNKKIIEELSSEFYTNIPHNFGWKKPPPIDSPESFQKEVDLVNMLNDIVIAQSLGGKAGTDQGRDRDATFDRYSALKNRMDLVPSSSKEFKVVKQYIESTQQRKVKLVALFSLEREAETSRSAKHKGLDNRKLLWHGTSPAVVAAILSSGLRIMPHSGGRVGRGIYLASEQSKSYGYTRALQSGPQRGQGFMFLVEAALGKESDLYRDDSSLKQAPKGYDSIVARGRTEPDPKKDITMDSVIPGKKVIVPQGMPVQQSRSASSSFTQSEYLLYQESQAHLRYLCVIQS